MIRFAATIRPCSSRIPAVRYFTTGRVRSRYADASTRRTPLVQVQVNDGLLHLRLVGAVDQVEAVRQVRHRARQSIDGRRDASERQAGRSEETQHPRPSHLLDEVGRANAVGHRAAEVGVAQAVVGRGRILSPRLEGTTAGTKKVRWPGGQSSECIDNPASPSIR